MSSHAPSQSNAPFNGRPFMQRFMTIAVNHRMTPAVCMLLCTTMPLAANAECWTVKAEGGVIAKSNETAAINTGQIPPLKPNPKDAQWRCRYNNVWFHRNEKGEAFDDKAVDRMLTVALSAFKSDSYIRVCFKQDSNNDCYTYQMFDIGRDP